MKVIEKLTFQLRLKRILSSVALITALSCLASVFAGIFTSGSFTIPLIFGALIFMTGVISAVFLGNFSKPDPEQIVRFLDRNYPFTEESSSLLVGQPENLFEQWQREKIETKFREYDEEIQIPGRFYNSSIYLSAGIFVLSALLFLMIPQMNQTPFTDDHVVATDSSDTEISTGTPAVITGEIIVTPPSYTNLSAFNESLGNFSVPEISETEWLIQTNEITDSVRIHFNNRPVMNLSGADNRFSGQFQVKNSQIFQLEIIGRDTTIFSDYNTLSVINDRPPQFLFQSPAEQRSYIDHQTRSQLLDVRIEDDYGITQANIHATLARGSGENVRFRERSISFDEINGLGSPTVNGRLELNAGSLEMQPGDELYFYVTAQDNKPNSQTGRSETYFIVYSDTSRADATPFSGMVVDLTPDDLRSQRQVIIDTENLMEIKTDISDQQFRDRTDRIAQDQALLRLRYGEYLGLENESGMTAADIPPDADEHTSESDHSHVHDHDHDHGNIDEEGFERAQSDIAALAPEDFMHDHGSAEMNTLFGDSPRGYLREALANMWDAERYLRMSDLEQALPFEYRALEFLQLAQQAERRYVRRAGYQGDPIPVNEVRLTKNIEDFAEPGSMRDTNVEPGPLSNLQYLIRTNTAINSSDFNRANRWIQQADVADEDRLFLLNRLRIFESEGLDDELRRELLQKLNSLDSQRTYDPNPARRPSLRPANR